MTEDFVTQLRLQLREAALREERRTPVALRVVRARRGLPGPAPMAAALAVVLLALVVALGALALRGEPEPAAPKLIGTYPVASGLSPLAPAFGAVWTADPIRGEVLRIDPPRGASSRASRCPARRAWRRARVPCGRWPATCCTPATRGRCGCCASTRPRTASSRGSRCEPRGRRFAPRDLQGEGAGAGRSDAAPSPALPVEPARRRGGGALRQAPAASADATLPAPQRPRLLGDHATS